MPGRISACLAACAGLLLSAADGKAQSNQELIEIIREQQRQIEELSRKVDALSGETEAASEKAAAAVETAQKVEQEAPDLQVKWAPGPTFSSKDGSWWVHVRGRLFVDGGALGDEDDLYKNDNGTELRAARLGIEGSFLEGWSYKFETDFADGDVDIKDAYVEYDGALLDPAYIRVGQHKTPNSLEELTSSRFITFMERAAITDAFGLDRQIGLAGVPAARTGASMPACSARTPATSTTTRAMRSPAAVTMPSSPTPPSAAATAARWSTSARRRATATSTTTPSTARSPTVSARSSISPARAA
jgi:hypothetical protein